MNIGRTLVIVGLALVCLGALVILAQRLHLPLGRLPGDIVWRGKNSTVYFPWVTCLLISALATLVLWLLNNRR